MSWRSLQCRVVSTHALRQRAPIDRPIDNTLTNDILEVIRNMPKQKPVHIRTKAATDSPMRGGCDRSFGYASKVLASVGPRNADRGTCRRCIKAKVA